jgi:hypothetical protein
MERSMPRSRRGAAGEDKGRPAVEPTSARARGEREERERLKAPTHPTRSMMVTIIV